MVEKNPWKTPFGRLLIGSSIVAAIVGFSLAAGVATYFRTESPAQEEFADEAVVEDAVPSAISRVDEASAAQRDVMTDPEGYAAALAELGPPPLSDGALAREQVSDFDDNNAFEGPPALDESALSQVEEPQTPGGTTQ